VFGDGAGSPVDQGVATWLMVGAVFLGWIGIARLRNRAFAKVPRPMGWVLTGLGATALILALVLPPIIRPDTAKVRPSSTAVVSIASPRPGQVFHTDTGGDPAQVPVVIRLVGGRLVNAGSTTIVPNTGHLHIYLDGGITSMTAQLRSTIAMNPGEHTLSVEFVASDHAPWNPRVRASVRFDVEP
jgi:hypothetical protein